MSATMAALRRGRRIWQCMSPQERAETIAWLFGIFLMGLAVIGAFGWWGILFIIGFIFWSANDP